MHTSDGVVCVSQLCISSFNFVHYYVDLIVILFEEQLLKTEPTNIITIFTNGVLHEF